MRAQEFASRYPRDILPPPEEDGSAYANAQRWSALFGRELHDQLSSIPPPSAEGRIDLMAYARWADTYYIELGDRLLAKKGLPTTVERASEQYSELSFHELNIALLPMRIAAETPSDTEKGRRARRDAIIVAQGRLGIQAASLCYLRAHMVKENKYFGDAFSPLRKSVQGRLAEMDTAATILDHIRDGHAGYGLFAAPAQFEHGRSSQYNVDLILTDPARDQALGIQVKTVVHPEDLDKYSKDIMLVDGVTDLEGEMLVQTGADMKAVRPWGGMIALSYLVATPRSDLEIIRRHHANDTTTILRQGLMARSALAGVSSSRKVALERIGARIEHYLAA